jgi:hypothetical protein
VNPEQREERADGEDRAPAERRRVGGRGDVDADLAFVQVSHEGGIGRDEPAGAMVVATDSSRNFTSSARSPNVTCVTAPDSTRWMNSENAICGGAPGGAEVNPSRSCGQHDDGRSQNQEARTAEAWWYSHKRVRFTSTPQTAPRRQCATGRLVVRLNRNGRFSLSCLGAPLGIGVTEFYTVRLGAVNAKV